MYECNIICVDVLSWRWQSMIPHSFSVGCTPWPPSEGNSMERQDKDANFTVDTWQTVPHVKWSMLVSRYDRMCSWLNVIKIVLSLWSSSPKHITQSNNEKEIIQVLFECLHTKYLSNIPQNHQGHQKQEEFEQLL